jgi:hypothetical protein
MTGTAHRRLQAGLLEYSALLIGRTVRRGETRILYWTALQITAARPSETSTTMYRPTQGRIPRSSHWSLFPTSLSWFLFILFKRNFCCLAWLTLGWLAHAKLRDFPTLVFGLKITHFVLFTRQHGRRSRNCLVLYTRCNITPQRRSFCTHAVT